MRGLGYMLKPIEKSQHEGRRTFLEPKSVSRPHYFVLLSIIQEACLVVTLVEQERAWSVS